MRLLSLIAICIWANLTMTTSGALAAPERGTVISAARGPNQDWRELAAQYYANPVARQSMGASAFHSAQDVDQLDLSKLAVWTPQQLKDGFTSVRDARFLQQSDMPGFARRSSWLYPDDGCFARAAHAGLNLLKWNYPRPNKIFAVGNLSVKTPNHPGGRVDWWWHVVPAILVGGEPYVLDPSIEPKNPLKLKDWLAAMTADIHSLNVSICHPTTYAQGDDCVNGNPGETSQTTKDQDRFLRF